ncbi:hypothetical protein [Notoacmeibacter marinus]|uniref:hypothetical protein n=1 Tax=Notoacmeibacter marinus TaxID=1876515 RepID=UPI000DF36F74|nr:hypothetical protein [Notoacmeibacter marinus]
MQNLFVAGLGMGLVAAVMASSPEAQAAPDRYVMDRTEDGWVRMDGQTGEITVCRQQGGKLTCQTDLPDGRAAPADQTRIDRLEERVAKLESRLQAGAAEKEPLPSEEEFDQALGYMQRFFEAFRDMVRDLQAEEKAGGAL